MSALKQSFKSIVMLWPILAIRGNFYSVRSQAAHVALYLSLKGLMVLKSKVKGLSQGNLQSGL